MKNNDGRGLYDIGERHPLSCGCVVVAEEIGYTHYVHPECKLDNKYHPQQEGYHYEQLYKEKGKLRWNND